MDIKTFALSDWVARELLILKHIQTSDIFADAMTKPSGRQLHYQHHDYILGKYIPSYASYLHTHEPRSAVLPHNK